jgi:hypothetical protein
MDLNIEVHNLSGTMDYEERYNWNLVAPLALAENDFMLSDALMLSDASVETYVVQLPEFQLEAPPSPSNPFNAGLAEPVQEKLLGLFLDSGTLITAEQVDLKKGETVQLKLLNCVSRNIGFMMLHSHPRYSQSATITSGDSLRPCVFDVWTASNTSIYTKCKFPDNVIGDAHVKVLELNNGEDIVNFTFNTLSSDRQNAGNLKEARQWMLVFFPIDSRSMDLINSDDFDENLQITTNLLEKWWRRNVQVTVELRKSDIRRREKRKRSAATAFPWDTNQDRSGVEKSGPDLGHLGHLGHRLGLADQDGGEDPDEGEPDRKRRQTKAYLRSRFSNLSGLEHLSDDDLDQMDQAFQEFVERKVEQLDT